VAIWKRWRTKEGKRVERKSRRLASLSDALELYGEAAGLAQEGQTEEARGIVQRYLQEPRKIVVLTGPDGGSREFRRYVLSLAERMDCEIWHIRPRGFEDRETREGFVEGREGVSYHELKVEGELEAFVHKLLGSLKRVELILTEEEDLQEAGLPVAVFVFTPRASG
jgi:hypothetical protein